MRLKAYIAIICIQIASMIFLFFQIKHKSNNTLGVSVNIINSKTIKKSPMSEFKYFYEPKRNTIEKVNEWGPYKGTYTINNDSLNERYNYSGNKERNVFRIITLGDSYTYGLYVDTKDNWTEVLEDKLQGLSCDKKIEVINLGVQGYDPAYEVERYKLRGTKYDPNLIIWFLIDPDRISESIYEIMQKNHDKLVKQGVNINSYDPWNLAWEEVLKIYGEKGIYKHQLDALRKINKLYIGKILFIVQKTESLTKPFPYMYEFKNERANTEIHEIISIYDKPRLHFPQDYHPNIEGHKAIAEDVLNYLKKSKLIPCGK